MVEEQATKIEDGVYVLHVQQRLTKEQCDSLIDQWESGSIGSKGCKLIVVDGGATLSRVGTDREAIESLGRIELGLTDLGNRLGVIEQQMAELLGAYTELIEALNAAQADDKDEPQVEYDLSGNPYPASRN